jgi:hypothetical protein
LTKPAWAAGKSPRGAGADAGGSAITRTFGGRHGVSRSAAVHLGRAFRRRRALSDDEATTWLGVVRWLVAVPSRPRSGPLGPIWVWAGHVQAVLPLVVGGVAQTGGGLDGDMLTVARRRELHKPAGSVGARG